MEYSFNCNVGKCDYEIKVMDTTHCKIRPIECEKFGTAMHIMQLQKDFVDQFRMNGVIIDNRFRFSEAI